MSDNQESSSHAPSEDRSDLTPTTDRTPTSDGEDDMIYELALDPPNTNIHDLEDEDDAEFMGAQIDFS